MLRFVAAITLLMAASQPLLAQDVDDDGSYRMLLSVGGGRFTGKYGQPETTTLDVLSLNARWYYARGEVQISLPYLQLDQGADVRFVDGQPIALPGDAIPSNQQNVSGLGDVVVRGEYYLRTGTSTTPWIIGLVRLKLPTGNEAKGLGTGSADVEVGVDLIQRHGRLNWMADVGYTFAGDAFGLDSKNMLRLGAGVAMPFGNDERSNAYVYLEQRANRFAGSDDRRSFAVGVGTALDKAKRLRISASIFVGLSDTAEDLGLYLTIGHRY